MSLVFFQGFPTGNNVVLSESNQVSMIGQLNFVNSDYKFYSNSTPSLLGRVVVSNQKPKLFGWINGG